MADTLQNIPLQSGQWVDLYDQSGINASSKVVINNIGACDIFYSVSADQPSLNNTAYKVLKPRDIPAVIGEGSSGLWAFSPNTDGRVNVELYSPIEPQPKTTAFGEMSVAENTPVVQISAQYGLTDEVMAINSAGGSSRSENSLFVVESGTNPLGLGSLNTLKQLAYKAGQGALCRITAVFTAGVAASLQAAGLINSEDAFAFGYLGADFGILYSRNGVVEAQELTLTAAATGAETASITVNGTVHNVAITAGTAQHNAYEIATGLAPLVPNYLVSSNDSTVFIMAQIPGPNGAFAYSSSGNSAGSFAQESAGADPVIELIPQSQWNRNQTPWLDPTKGNVYSISIQYLGFGGIAFYVEEPETRELLVVHVIEYANKHTTPSVGNPTFRIGWLARNLGNTSNLTVSGASAAGFVEGQLRRDKLPIGRSNTVINIGTTNRNILTIRNRFHFGGRINRAEIIPLILSLGTDSGKGVLFELIANAQFEDDVTYQYIDRNGSVSEFATDSVEITPGSGRSLVTFYVSSNGAVINSNEFKTSILPDDWLTLAARDVQLNNTFATGSASWQEDT